ncbi:peptide chain release factor 1 [Oculatella sp. LEGE 06141]|uniref:peptide chain release factor 1 n=1 Tax=Oculatella sp. LEGE 06141 TaxID=1828648 RepID=UPI00187F98B0|nr:peptide chain release factor 1 [Oculatella sp. LEGE 06141]MBE9179880.1 peptide chain release factor 1 [Oculatella sp. LEGE 06141]
MGNPLQRLKYLPWFALLQVAALTILLAFLAELLVWVGYTQVDLIQSVFNILFAPPLGLLVIVAIAAGIGTLSVWLLEVTQPKLSINSGILWALVFCLIVMVAIKSLLQLPSVFISLNQVLLIGILVGVFWRGRRHWRY